jgi:hypothetical protein
MSTGYYAPTYTPHRWPIKGARMRFGRGSLKKVVIVLSTVWLGVPTTATAAAVSTARFQSAPAGVVLPAGRQGTATDIPWSQVGPGWLLSEWQPVAPSETSEAAKPAPRSVLFLIDPLGGRYAIGTKTTSADSYLAGWSGDGKRALFETQTGSPTTSLVTVLQLQSGRTATFKIAGSGSRSIGFTEPDGLAIIAGGEVVPSGTTPVQRFDLDGALAYTYPTSFARAGRVDGGLLYAPDGAELILGTTGGFEVVTNSGQPVRYLPMSKGAGTCQPTRWWAAGVMLASCVRPNSGVPLLWLVPTNGARPKPLTVTPKRDSGDLGDVDAWSLSGRVYLQDIGACGYIYLAKLGAAGRTTPVKVPGTEEGKSVYVLGAYHDKLALTTSFACSPGSVSLLWFDPASDVVTPLLGPPVNGGSTGTVLLWGQTPYFPEF